LNFTNREETQKHLKYVIQVQSYLIKKYNVIPKREWFITLDHEDKFSAKPHEFISEVQKMRRDSYRCPDLVFYDKEVLFIVEIDGFVHYIKSEKTNKRNQIYLNNKCNFIAIDTYDIDGKGKIIDRDIEKVFKELDYKISRFK